MTLGVVQHMCALVCVRPCTHGATVRILASKCTQVASCAVIACAHARARVHSFYIAPCLGTGVGRIFSVRGRRVRASRCVVALLRACACSRTLHLLPPYAQALGADYEMQDGERLPLAVKDLGSSDLYPQSLQHNPNGRFVTVCGDGEYVVYTALAWRNKSFGQVRMQRVRRVHHPGMEEQKLWPDARAAQCSRGRQARWRYSAVRRGQGAACAPSRPRALARTVCACTCAVRASALQCCCRPSATGGVLKHVRIQRISRVHMRAPHTCKCTGKMHVRTHERALAHMHASGCVPGARAPAGHGVCVEQRQQRVRHPRVAHQSEAVQELPGEAVRGA